MKRRWIVAAALAVAAGCGRAEPVGKVGSTASTESSPALTLTDSLGRKVVIARRPERIVSLAPALTETLFAVGAGPRVVAVTTADTYPPEAKALPTVGGFSPKTLSVEAVVGQRPDLVIATGRFQQAAVESLQALGVTVLALDADTIEEVAANIRLVGRATGTEAEAGRIADDMLRRAGAVRRRTAAGPAGKRPRVVYFLWDEPLKAGGPGTFIGQMIVDAGGENLFADASQQYPQVSDEAVLVRDPDLILTSDHGNIGLPARLARRPGWAALKAVRAGRVVALDEELMARPGPRLIDGLESVAKAIHSAGAELRGTVPDGPDSIPSPDSSKAREAARQGR